MTSMHVCSSAHQGFRAPTTNFRKLRKGIGLAIAAIGLSASIASAATIPVTNGNFETEYGSNIDKTINWVKLTSWSLENTSIGKMSISGNFSSDPDGGSYFTRFTWNNAGVEQNLSTNVSAGDTLSVTFNLGVSLGAWDQDASRVKGNAYFMVGSTYYKMPFDLTGKTAGVWYPFTFTTNIINSGNLSIGFQNLGVANNYYTSLDGVSDVTWTPAANDPDAPSSANATLTVDEDTVSALTTNNFGYSDPHTNALAAVRITTLPTLGTLKLSGTAVTNNEIVAVADINAGYLTYLAATNANGTAYTTIGIKVMNASNLWSIVAVMTVNVTSVNDAPTSTGGSVSTKENTAKTFAAANFQFSDVDTGNTLGAIKVTSIPEHGTLKTNGIAITTVPSDDIPVASIGTLTYTPAPDFVGADAFHFQVRDAVAFSADATMAITVIVNAAPTSTGSSVITRVNTAKTFAVANFPFADVDVGDTLNAIRVVTSLPAHGTLTLGGTPITSVPSDAIPTNSIGTLIYTPALNYVGSDAFKFQVSDGMAFSADATLAITVTSEILVSNGSFETPGSLLGGPWAKFGSPWSITGSPSDYQQIKAVDGGAFASAPDGLWVGLINGDDCPITAPLTQNLGISVSANDTLSVTFSFGRQTGAVGGQGVAYFDVNGTKYTMAFDASVLSAGNWYRTNMIQTITNSGNLILGFYGTSGHATNVWVDAISNITVTPPTPKGTVIILW